MGDIKDNWYILSKKTNTLLCGVDGYSLFLTDEVQANILAQQFFKIDDDYLVFCVKARI